MSIEPEVKESPPKEAWEAMGEKNYLSLVVESQLAHCLCMGIWINEKCFGDLGMHIPTQSENGWMVRSSPCGLERYFFNIPSERPALLLFDGHGSHVSLQLIERAVENNIILLKLLPHTIHVLQPLNVAVFKSMKTVWDRNLIKWKRQNPRKKIFKNDFISLLTTVFDDMPGPDRTKAEVNCKSKPSDLNAYKLSQQRVNELVESSRTETTDHPTSNPTAVKGIVDSQGNRSDDTIESSAAFTAAADSATSDSGSCDVNDSDSDENLCDPITVIQDDYLLVEYNGNTYSGQVMGVNDGSVQVKHMQSSGESFKCRIRGAGPVTRIARIQRNAIIPQAEQADSLLDQRQAVVRERTDEDEPRPKKHKRALQSGALNYSLLKFTINEGGVLLIMENKNDADKFRSIATTELSATYNIRIVNGVLPRIKVVGIIDDMTLNRFIFKQNPKIFTDEGRCKLLQHTATKKNKNIYQAVYQVDVITYKKLMEAGRMMQLLNSDKTALPVTYHKKHSSKDKPKSIIQCYYQNVRGLNTKISEFFCHLLVCDFDAIFLTETWLSDSVSSAELFHKNYTVYRKDRDFTTTGMSKGGGVLLAVNSFIKSSQVDL
ncbi:hypothetical protein ILUMI_08425 [Ignelater luminosus]|uniref:DDE-1 domain-containing protein n=1 Tax=Ignelater luminosus TaxID=2038154 RepID=A0A8K0GDF1_IGNLU|nr:hypothetical protein ILUMI_08425 [Ignelater luminosus]